MATLVVKNISREGRRSAIVFLIVLLSSVQLKGQDSRGPLKKIPNMNLNMRKVVMAQKSHQITSAIEKAALEHQKTQRELEKERRKELMSNLLGE